MAEEDPSPLLIALFFATHALFGLAVVCSLWMAGVFIPFVIFAAVFTIAVLFVRRQIIKARDADELADHQA